MIIHIIDGKYYIVAGASQIEKFPAELYLQEVELEAEVRVGYASELRPISPGELERTATVKVGAALTMEKVKK